MPTKKNHAGNQQNYVPKGNGDASGEYGDNATGSNKHFQSFFKSQVSGKVDGDEKLEMNNDEKKKTYEYAKHLVDISSEEFSFMVTKDKLDEYLDKDLITTEQYSELKQELENKQNGNLTPVEDKDATYNKLKDALSKDKTESQLDSIATTVNYSHYQGLLSDEQKAELENIIADKKKGQESNITGQENQAQQGNTPKQQQIKPLKKTWQKQVSKMNDEDCYNVLLNTYEGEFDTEKLKNATTEELHDLVMAKKNTELKTSNVDKKFEKKVKALDEQFYNENLSHIWVSVPKAPDELEKSIKLKEEWFEKSKKIAEEDLKENPDGIFSKKELQKSINALKLMGDLKNGTLKEWQDAKLGDLETQETIAQSNELLEKYANPDNVYSASAKNKAKWFKSYESAVNYFGDMKEIYNKIGAKDMEYVKDYTSSYSFINEPLRNKKYIGSGKKEKFVEAVKGMTNAIDKSTLKEGIWVQRGVNELNINGVNLSYNATTEDLNNLIGKSFEDQGFYSASAHKGASFGLSKSVVINTYAPKGTKALYVNPISYFSGGSENEIILQRGYSYKITKAYKSNGKIFLDAEVVLGSDIKKHDDKKLKELQQTKFSS